MSRFTPRVCECGCGETFMARTSDIARGYGRFKNRSHATRGPNNARWQGGRSTNDYYYKSRSIAKHPLKHKCRLVYTAALRAGVLRRGCCEFYGDPKTEGHHEDYDQPYQVRWLCRKHHRLVDKWRRQREQRE